MNWLLGLVITVSLAFFAGSIESANQRLRNKWITLISLVLLGLAAGAFIFTVESACRLNSVHL